MPLATRERIWDELPPLDGEPEVKEEIKETKDEAGNITRVKVRTERVRKLKCVEERKGWTTFGIEEEHLAANESMSEAEECEWEDLLEDKKVEEKPVEKRDFEAIKCRFCGGSHFSHECPKKVPDGAAEASAPEAAKPAERPSAAAAAAAPAAGEKYSFKQRLGLTSSRSEGGSSDRSEGFQVRVSNLSENARERDVVDLFGRFGKIKRCFVKMNYDNTKSSGFAFVTFETKEQADRAVANLNGHPYDHLILSVEHRQTDK